MKRFFKIFAYLACTQLVLAPVAYGESTRKRSGTQKEFFLEMLQKTGYSSEARPTVGVFYQKLKKNVMDGDSFTFFNYYNLGHRNNLMPELQVSSKKTKSGSERLVMVFGKGVEQLRIETMDDVPGNQMMVNNTVINVDDYKSMSKIMESLYSKDEQFRKSVQAHENDKFIPDTRVSYEEYSQMPKDERLNYVMRLRDLSDAAQSFQDQWVRPVAKKSAYVSIFAQAYADDAPKNPYSPNKCIVAPEVGKECIVSGWIGQYEADANTGAILCSDNQALAGMVAASKKDFPRASIPDDGVACPNGGTPCNPYLYGFDNGKVFCGVSALPTQLPPDENQKAFRKKEKSRDEAEKSDPDFATHNCNYASPLHQAGQAENEQEPNYVQNKRKIALSMIAAQKPTDGIKSEASIFSNDGKIVDQNAYNSVMDLEGKVNSLVDQELAVCKKNAESPCFKPDQANACGNLTLRKMKFEALSGKPDAVVPLAPGEGPCKDKGEPNATTVEKNKCPVVPPAEGGGINKWVLAGGAGLLGLGIGAWLLSSNKTKTKTKTRTVTQFVCCSCGGGLPPPPPGTCADPIHGCNELGTVPSPIDGASGSVRSTQ